MADPLRLATAVAGAYLIGAFPTSYVAGRLAAGIDLREHGSRNLGATNVYRVLGWRVAIPVAAVDIAKGALPVLLLAPWAVPGSPLGALGIGVVAMLGHVFSAFVRFKGGKGVATVAGVMAALTPAALGLAVVLWALLARLTGYVSVASMTAAAAFPALVWLLHPDWRPHVWVDVLVAGAIVWFHRSNVRRLLRGTENRFGRGRPAAAGPA